MKRRPESKPTIKPSIGETEGKIKENFIPTSREPRAGCPARFYQVGNPGVVGMAALIAALDVAMPRGWN
jgi:hypothetical protein